MDYIKAFLIGGALCLVGQILIDKTKLTPARILVSYVVLGVFLSALDRIRSRSCKGVKEAVAEKGFLGILTGGLKAAAGGVTVAVFCGLLVSLIFKDKDKT